MSRIKVKRSDEAFRAILAACYPFWKRRKLMVQAATCYRMTDFWDGGSRDYVVAYDLATGRVSQPVAAAKNPFRAEAHSEVEIPEGTVLVEHSIFCGKDAGITIYVNPANMPKLLSA